MALRFLLTWLSVRLVFHFFIYLADLPFTHSFICGHINSLGNHLQYWMSMLVSYVLERVSPAVGFYTGIACICFACTILPYIKFFYPDQAYMFFNLVNDYIVNYFLSKVRINIAGYTFLL